MRITWRQRLEQQPKLTDFSRWPTIDRDSLPRARRKAFLRNQQIVVQVLNRDPFKQIARQHNLSIGRISQLMERCLGGDDELPPALTQGLIAYKVVVTKQRKKPLSTLHKNNGNACAFQSLLNKVPGLHKALDDMILAKLKDARYAQRLAPQAFHGEFKRILVECHWPQDQYPYTTASLAYESLRVYLDQRTAELYQQQQQCRQPASRNLGTPSKRYRALRAIQIDEHILDLNCAIHLQLNDELIPLRIARANVLVAADVDTNCALGYYLTPTRYPNQQDLLTLLDRCIAPWQPIELTTSGLSYAPGACFPSGLGEAFPISFGTVQLDNALMHRAQSAINLLCEQFGATLSYGLPAMPKVRELVESVFDRINQRFSHRVASTAGSHPTDPSKESYKNLKKPPVITFEMLDEMLSVILTEYNITPMASLGNASPLTLYQHHCDTQYIRHVPQLLAQHWQPLIGTAELVLHWYKQEYRMPHVNFYHAKYQGHELLKIASKDKHIRVEFDYRDIRTLHAFSLAGEDLGLLYAPTSWQRFPHSLATRQWIYKNTKHYHLNTRDPLSSYFRLLLESKGKPKMALALLRVYHEFTWGQTGSLVLGESDKPISSSLLTNKPRQHIWNSNTANHRG